MTKLTYPVKVTFVEGNSLIYKVVDFPNIVGSSSSGLHDYIFGHLYDEIENALYELAYAGEEIPRPTLISSEERGDYIYITVPFERKEFYCRAISPVENAKRSRQINHPLCGCASKVIPKKAPFLLQ